MRMQWLPGSRFPSPREPGYEARYLVVLDKTISIILLLLHVITNIFNFMT